MFASVLIANRGEIACRIARTARRLGMRVIAIHSEAEPNALHVRLADEAVGIGPAPAAESYLAIDRIVAAARKTGAECVHPGYGFLAENARFAEALAEAGIAFVGPPSAAIRAMGLKHEAKRLMEAAGVPVVPGYYGARQDPAGLAAAAAEIGYPVLIKAVAGGGGKGMRRVGAPAEFAEALASCRREAAAAFGDDRVLLERCITAPRHIEVQVFADAHGNTIHLGERDCSLQRRHQKLVEEAPAPGMSAELRAAMGAAAIAAARAVGYIGAGTVEFILDGAQGISPDAFYFMEMNTRLQVEHPVTEMVAGLDLVELQFRVAAGEPLPFDQRAVTFSGHAIEARLYAEDPQAGFLPATGRLAALSFGSGQGVRIDAGLEEGDEITPFYDPMIAKVIAHGPDRAAALDRLATALRETIIAGPRTNLGFLVRLLEHPDFRAGRFDTGFIDAHLESLAAPPPGRRAAIALGAVRLLEREAERAAERRAAACGAWPSPWGVADGFSPMPQPRLKLEVLADAAPETVEIDYGRDGIAAHYAGRMPDWDSENPATLVDASDAVHVIVAGWQTSVRLPPPPDPEAAAHEASLVKAPMHGRIVALGAEPGTRVARGARLFVVEAMKMEHAVLAPRDGVITEVHAAVGDQVEQGAVVVALGAETD